MKLVLPFANSLPYSKINHFKINNIPNNKKGSSKKQSHQYTNTMHFLLIEQELLRQVDVHLLQTHKDKIG